MSAAGPDAGAGAPRRDLALVYRGPASTPGCPEAVAAALARSRWNLEVRFVGPAEDLPLDAGALSHAVLYAQPGGGGLRRAYRKVKAHAPAIRDFVAAGGHYLGFCLGGYLAGDTPGFGLLPGDTDQYIATRGATVVSTRDTLVRVRWRGHPRQLYFQDGPTFLLAPGATGAAVLARYPNDEIAALTVPFGAGIVGVVGPHPEATHDWYRDTGLVGPDGLDTDLGHDLIEAVMSRRGVPIPHPRRSSP